MANTPVLEGLGERHYGCIMISEAQLARGDTPPAAVSTGTCMSYGYTIADDSRITLTMPDDWFPGTAMYAAIRWMVNENFALNSGHVRWQCAYETIDQNNQVVGAGTSGTVTTGDIAVPTTALQIQNTSITIPAADLSLGDTLNLDIERIALIVGPGALAAEPLILCVRLLYSRKFPAYYLTA
jgi:hypothetical protein